jgi:hypothetical protein
MAAMQEVAIEEFPEVLAERYLRLVTSESASRPLRTGRTLGDRRYARAQMMRRRRRTLVGLALVSGLLVLSLPGPAFGGVTGAGLATDLATSSTLASGMNYVVQPGDSFTSIAQLMNPVSPSKARTALRRELGSSAVVPGEHILIP